MLLVALLVTLECPPQLSDANLRFTTQPRETGVSHEYSFLLPADAIRISLQLEAAATPEAIAPHGWGVESKKGSEGSAGARVAWRRSARTPKPRASSEAAWVAGFILAFSGHTAPLWHRYEIELQDGTLIVGDSTVYCVE